MLDEDKSFYRQKKKYDLNDGRIFGDHLEEKFLSLIKLYKMIYFLVFKMFCSTTLMRRLKGVADVPHR